MLTRCLLKMLIGVPMVVPVMIGLFFFFQAEDGIRDYKVTGVQTCALPISGHGPRRWRTPNPGPTGRPRPRRAPAALGARRPPLGPCAPARRCRQAAGAQGGQDRKSVV